MISSIPSSVAFSVASLFVTSFVLTAATSNYGGVTRHYQFHIRLKNITRLCHTKSMITVNGKFPGPRIVAREGDRLLVKVVNHVPNNITIHWHGVRQLRSAWWDGPSYITQCPIQSGQSYVYNFSIVEQRGTLFWHAHNSWLRATLYGPLIILPRHNESYPFAKPTKEIPIIFGEWWNVDPESVIAQALHTGGGPNVSDAFTINGLPGPFYSCSSNDIFRLKVKPGKTYLLRLINAAMNNELFFSIANHSMTIVEADATYVKPFNSNIIVISPGQTTNVLLKTKPEYTNTKFFMLARPFFTGKGTFDNSTLAGILEYDNNTPPSESPTLKPNLPVMNDTSFVAEFSGKFRSLNSAKYPANVPQTVDKKFFFTVGLGTMPCPRNQTCEGPNSRTKYSASMNNVSFDLPSVAILQQHFSGKVNNNNNNNNVYNTDFPVVPPRAFNYTGTPPKNTMVRKGTKVVMIPYNTRVEVVLQDTSILSAESHPLHLHGFNMFVVGQGFGNFDHNTDPAKFNLVDPVERNTVGVPSAGWVAIRFIADNPGVWLMHCHIELHMSWGLRMAWIVNDGKLSHQKLPPPPADFPKC